MPKSSRKMKLPPMEAIVTRNKSALLKRQLRNKDESIIRISQITQLLRSPTGKPRSPNVKTSPKSPTKQPQKKSKASPKKIQNSPKNRKENEYYPNKLKRKLKGKTAMLRAKQQLKLIGGAKTNFNNKELSVKDKWSVEHTQIERNLEQPNVTTKKMTTPELSVEEIVQLTEESESLDDEDLLEILTCPSPVWWEDPPNEFYIEDAICSRSPTRVESRNHRAKKRKIPRKCNTDIQFENERGLKEAIEETNEKVIESKQNDEKFMEKRSKLEDLLGNIKNKLEKSVTPRKHIAPDYKIINFKFKIKTDTNNTVSNNTCKSQTHDDRHSVSTEGDDVFLNFIDDDILNDLENMDIPIEPDKSLVESINNDLKPSISGNLDSRKDLELSRNESVPSSIKLAENKKEVDLTKEVNNLLNETTNSGTDSVLTKTPPKKSSCEDNVLLNVPIGENQNITEDNIEKEDENNDVNVNNKLSQDENQQKSESSGNKKEANSVKSSPNTHREKMNQLKSVYKMMTSHIPIDFTKDEVLYANKINSKQNVKNDTAKKKCSLKNVKKTREKPSRNSPELKINKNEVNDYIDKIKFDSHNESELVIENGEDNFEKSSEMKINANKVNDDEKNNMQADLHIETASNNKSDIGNKIDNSEIKQINYSELKLNKKNMQIEPNTAKIKSDSGNKSKVRNEIDNSELILKNQSELKIKLNEFKDNEVEPNIEMNIDKIISDSENEIEGEIVKFKNLLINDKEKKYIQVENNIDTSFGKIKSDTDNKNEIGNEIKYSNIKFKNQFEMNISEANDKKNNIQIKPNVETTDKSDYDNKSKVRNDVEIENNELKLCDSCNSNKSSKIVPNSDKVKYCLKCSCIFETEECAYCVKKAKLISAITCDKCSLIFCCATNLLNHEKSHNIGYNDCSFEGNNQQIEVNTLANLESNKNTNDT